MEHELEPHSLLFGSLAVCDGPMELRSLGENSFVSETEPQHVEPQHGWLAEPHISPRIEKGWHWG
jgi:hypothetical protein